MRIHHATLAKAKKFQIVLTVEENEVVATSKTGVRLASGLQGNKVLEDAITKATGHAAKSKGATKPNIDKKASAQLGRKVTKAQARLIAQEAAEEDGDAELETDEEAGTKSIVKSKYKERYKPTKHRCGDELGDKVTAHVLRENDDGEMRIDVAALRKFSKANGVWVEGYASFKSRTGAANTGMMRMNVLNRLRAKIRHAMKEDPKLDVNKFVVWA